MRTFIGPAVLVAIGLMWSVAAMSKLVPVPSEDLKTAATSLDVVTVGQGKSASAELRYLSCDQAAQAATHSTLKLSHNVGWNT